MNMTRIKLILALALALATGYSASAQRNNNRNFDRTQGNMNSDFGPGQRNNFGGRNNFGYSSTVSTNIPGPTNYTRFSQFISQRNIFNPARFAIVAGQRPPVVRQGPPPVTPTFGLVGTMAYEKGMFAFFDGNNSQYQKVLYASESNTIAGFIVADVTTSGVKLQSADKTQSLTFKIGDTLRQQDDGSWDFGGAGGAFASPGAGGFGAASSASGFMPSTSTEPSAAAPVAPSAAVQGNDILRRLMQERQQQLK